MQLPEGLDLLPSRFLAKHQGRCLPRGTYPHCAASVAVAVGSDWHVRGGPRQAHPGCDLKTSARPVETPLGSVRFSRVSPTEGDASVMALELNEILKIALKGGASDIHLKSGLPPMFRVDGALVPLKNGERIM